MTLMKEVNLVQTERARRMMVILDVVVQAGLFQSRPAGMRMAGSTISV